MRQTWYVSGRDMRTFKWSIDFRCSLESPIVPILVSLPYLPIHFIYCKAVLFSIAAAIGTPLRVDHATTSVNRPSVARVLFKYDVSWLYCHVFELVRGMLVFGRILFLSEFLHIVLHVSILVILLTHVMLLTLCFASLIC